MARPATVARVHDAVLRLAATHGPTALTMEGVAAAAGVGKQTLYRTWPSVPAVLFDALLAHSADRPDTDARTDASTDDEGDPGTLPARLERLLGATVAELTEQPHESLLRVLTAAIQTDDTLAREFHTRLLEPQRNEVRALLAVSGITDADSTAELLLAPVATRWLLRLPAMTDDEIARLVAHVLAGARATESDQLPSPTPERLGTRTRSAPA